MLNECDCITRFECLNLKCLSESILSEYCEVLGKFSSEIDKIQKVYFGVFYTEMRNL